MKRNNIIFTVVFILVGVFMIGVVSYLVSEGAEFDFSFPWDSEGTTADDEGDESISDESEIGTESALGIPSIALNDNILTITPGDGTEAGYEIYANGDYTALTEELSVDLAVLFTGYSAGTYVIKVRAYDNAENKSAFSNTVSYVYGSAVETGLTAPSISLSGTVLTIRAGSGTATQYEIYKSVDGNGFSLFWTVSYQAAVQTVDLSNVLSSGHNWFTVSAVNTGTSESAICMSSVYYFLDTTSPVVLDTPTLSMSGYSGTISEVENATGYQIYVNDVLKAESLLPIFSFADLTFDAGSYAVKVRAYYTASSGTVYSSFSNTVTFVVPETLTTPSISVSDSCTVTISEVLYATGYEIYLDGTRVAVTLVPGMSFSDLELDDGSYTVTVRAYYTKTGGAGTLYSAFSNAVTYTVGASTYELYVECIYDEEIGYEFEQIYYWVDDINCYDEYPDDWDALGELSDGYLDPAYFGELTHETIKGISSCIYIGGYGADLAWENAIDCDVEVVSSYLDNKVATVICVYPNNDEDFSIVIYATGN